MARRRVNHTRRWVIAVIVAVLLLIAGYLYSNYRANHNASVANHNKGVANTAQSNAQVAKAFLMTLCHSTQPTKSDKTVAKSACAMLHGLQSRPTITTQTPPIPGPAGPTGARGPRGFMGRPGHSGVPGSRGPSGSQGKPGATGPTGPSGLNGANGTNGSNGTGITNVDCNVATNHFVVTYSDGTVQSVDDSKCIGQDGQNGTNGQDATFPANNDASCASGTYMVGVHLSQNGNLSVDCGSLDALCPNGSTFQQLTVLSPSNGATDIWACVIGTASGG